MAPATPQGAPQSAAGADTIGAATAAGAAAAGAFSSAALTLLTKPAITAVSVHTFSWRMDIDISRKTGVPHFHRRRDDNPGRRKSERSVRCAYR